MELSNKFYEIKNLSADGKVKTSFTVFCYKEESLYVRCVKCKNGKKTAVSNNYTLKDFLTGLRLGSVIEVRDE